MDRALEKLLLYDVMRDSPAGFAAEKGIEALF